MDVLARLSDQDRDTLIALVSVPGVGRHTVLKVLAWCQERDQTLAEWWNQASAWSQAGLSEAQVEALKTFRARFSPAGYTDWLASKTVRTLILTHQDYPSLLAEIDDPPLVLFTWGQGSRPKNWPSFWQPPACAVVGTRKQTSYGQRVTTHLVQDLVATASLTIVSGFMTGVDVTAHQSALAAGGKTVAVLGYGQGMVYPRSLSNWYQDWLQRPDVVFVSEYPPDTKPMKAFFPHRNRVVAGMADLTLVTEAAAGSGSLITARLAAEYGRTVCAVPGSIFSPFSQGVVEVLNQGARLVRSATDVLDELTGVAAWQKAVSAGVDGPDWSRFKHLSQPERAILKYLHQQAASASSLAIELKIAWPELQVCLTKLELQDLVAKRGADWILADRVS